MGEEVLTALSPAQQVVKIVRDELTKMLGSHQSKLRFANEPPSVVLIVGLQGSGKTTSAGKLARFLTKEGHKPQLVSVDVYRPGRAAAAQHSGQAGATFPFTRARRKKRSRSIWRDPPAAKRCRPGATSCWSTPPAACISTKS